MAQSQLKKDNFEKKVKKQKFYAAPYKKENDSQDNEDDGHKFKDPDKVAL